MDRPTTGGRFTRDPKTKKLKQVQQATKPAPAPAPQTATPSEATATADAAKKGD
ncbi:hypothetical protein [Puniceibacterium sp. IMCC21224]|uniref:hypothetical protein n=1 Tax=Puniceibacterium sp. IMCC21224 TaxID=1618204 RepID=UPI00065DBCA9|nr:hypothetical protein [Puniceibacterium sp. IMCC21224]KMK68581.1 hypothetical protein IMCC21224_113464 [Puniceibacterium sp. IMCC21224]